RLVHAGDAHFVVELPNGVRLLLPAWMTEVEAAALPMMAAPRLTLACLRELRGLVDLQNVSSLPTDEAIRSGGGDDGAACPGTATRTSHAGGRRRHASAIRCGDPHGDRKPAQGPHERSPRPGQDAGGDGR